MSPNTAIEMGQLAKGTERVMDLLQEVIPLHQQVLSVNAPNTEPTITPPMAKIEKDVAGGLYTGSDLSTTADAIELSRGPMISQFVADH